MDLGHLGHELVRRVSGFRGHGVSRLSLEPQVGFQQFEPTAWLPIQQWLTLSTERGSIRSVST